MNRIRIFFLGQQFVKGSPYMEECGCCHEVLPLRLVKLAGGGTFSCEKCLRDLTPGASVGRERNEDIQHPS